IPELSMIAEGPTADKTIAPKLVALNDKLASDKSGQISNAEPSGRGGGFFTAGDAKFDFGASIKTMVNGQLALQTNLTWTPQGPDISSLSGLGQQIANQVQSSLAQAGIGTGAPSSPATTASNVATPAGNAASNPAAAASNLAANTASNAINNAASAAGASSKAPAVTANPAATPQTTVTIPSVVSSVTIPGSGGSTTVLNNIGANQIQSMILNTASGQRIDQNTNVMLTIYNLQQWQQQ